MNIEVMGLKCRVEVILVSLIVGGLLGSHLFCSCAKVSAKEGMEILGSALNDSIGNGNPNSWENKAYQYASGMNNDNRLARHNTYKGTPVPLPEGEMFLFADNEFKPECCGATFSASTGCACTSQEQIRYVNERGGNRTMPTMF